MEGEPFDWRKEPERFYVDLECTGALVAREVVNRVSLSFIVRIPGSRKRWLINILSQGLTELQKKLGALVHALTTQDDSVDDAGDAGGVGAAGGVAAGAVWSSVVGTGAGVPSASGCGGGGGAGAGAAGRGAGASSGA